LQPVNIDRSALVWESRLERAVELREFAQHLRVGGAA
jgi:hypothetical protein